MRIYLTIAGLLAVFCFSAAAQTPLEWIVDSISDTVNSTVIVPVKVNGFSNLISMQGTLDFDPNIISYGGVSMFGLTGLAIGNFGTTNTANGKLSFSWFDVGLGGQSLTDSSTVFAISFDLIGNMGSSSSITFGDDPVLLEFADTGFNTIAATYTTGAVSILDTTSSVGFTDLEQTNFGTAQVYPNPFTQGLNIAFEASEAGEMRIQLFSMLGKELYNEQHLANQGSNTVKLNHGAQFSEALKAGLYLMRLELNGRATSYQLIKN